MATSAPTVGPYRLDEPIGTNTWRAVHPQTKRVVRICLVPRALAQATQARRTLRHERILAVLATGPWAHGPAGLDAFVVLEERGDPSLADIVERHGPQPVDEAVAMVRLLIEPLQMLAGAGFAHGALGPRAVLLPRTPPSEPVLSLAGIGPADGAFGIGYVTAGPKTGPPNDVGSLLACLHYAVTGRPPPLAASWHAFVRELVVPASWRRQEPTGPAGNLYKLLQRWLAQPVSPHPRQSMEALGSELAVLFAAPARELFSDRPPPPSAPRPAFPSGNDEEVTHIFRSGHPPSLRRPTSNSSPTLVHDFEVESAEHLGPGSSPTIVGPSDFLARAAELERLRQEAAALEAPAAIPPPLEAPRSARTPPPLPPEGPRDEAYDEETGRHSTAYLQLLLQEQTHSVSPADRPPTVRPALLSDPQTTVGTVFDSEIPPPTLNPLFAAQTPRATSVPAPPPSRRRRWLLALLGGFFVALLLGGVAWYVLGKRAWRPRVLLLPPRALAHGPTADGSTSARPTVVSAAPLVSDPAPPLASATGPVAASAAAPVVVASESVEACVTSAFPSQTFAPDDGLNAFCSGSDARKGMSLLQRALGRGNKRVGASSAGASGDGSHLGWFRLGALASLRAACCPGAAPLQLATTTGSDETCAPLVETAEQLASAVLSGPDGPWRVALTAYRENVNCLVTQGSAWRYGYKALPVRNGEEAAFRAFAEHLRRTRNLPLSSDPLQQLAEPKKSPPGKSGRAGWFLAMSTWPYCFLGDREERRRRPKKAAASKPNAVAAGVDRRLTEQLPLPPARSKPVVVPDAVADVPPEANDEPAAALFPVVPPRPVVPAEPPVPPAPLDPPAPGVTVPSLHIPTVALVELQTRPVSQPLPPMPRQPGTHNFRSASQTRPD